MKIHIRKLLKIITPLCLGGAILYWMYRDFDFTSMQWVLTEGMNWWWMLLSMPFGILAQAIRGWRWKQSLEPLGEKPAARSCVDAIFMSYALSLVIPRVGEFARCGVLARNEKVSFAKALGTVVTERAIDSLLLLTITMGVIVSEMGRFGTFFQHTGVNIPELLRSFTWQGYAVTLLSAVAAMICGFFVIRRLTIYEKIRLTMRGLMEGVMSLRKVHNIPLYVAFTLGIWLSYFLHYYLTFFCFDATAHLGIGCALVTFIVGSIAVIVPTPNGAGPWHFAVKTMLILYGVAADEALFFVLIVHTLQTLLVVALGVMAAMRIKNK